MKFSAQQWRLAKLQRPPAEIRVSFPSRSARSRTAPRRPRLPASMAHINPAAPPPRIRASYLWIKRLLSRVTDPPDGIRTVVGNQQRAVRSCGDGNRTSPDTPIVNHEAGHEILIFAAGL